MQKNDETWNSFFYLLKLKKEGRLPPHVNHVSLPRYWKEGETKKRRKLLLVVRQDRYEVGERNRAILKDFDLEVEFAGRLRRYSKRGRLEIYYDETRNAWYAPIPVEVGLEEAKTGRKSEHIVREERKSIQIEFPKGDKVASIDLGINVLASVVIDDGTWLLYKGLTTKEGYFYFEKRIAGVQSLAGKTKNIREYEACAELSRERRLFKKLTRRLLHLHRNFASHLVKELHGLGVSTIYLGYPFNIAQDKGNRFTSKRSYRELMDTIELKAREYEMRIFEAIEYNTSKYCAYHDVEVTRNPRGVISCPRGHKMHSDLNCALNILKKAANATVSTVKKPFSFVVDHNTVAPVKGCNPRDLGEPSPFRARRRSVEV